MIKKGLLFSLKLLLLFYVSSQVYSQENLKLLSVSKIWNSSYHSGFTSLIEYNGQIYCAFREGSGHNSKDGAIRIITLNKNNAWYSIGSLKIKNHDLRDPKIIVNGENQLVVYGMSRFEEDGVSKHNTYTWVYKNKKWSKPFLDVSSINTWKWGIGYIDNKIYSIAYSSKDKNGTIYKSETGTKWEIVKENFFPNVRNFPNETAILQLQDKSVISLVRVNNGDKNALLGVSSFPYDKWDWKTLNKQIGGPSLIQLPNGDIYACVRLYDNVRTSICKLDVEKGTLKEVITLPSGYDSSYASMIVSGGKFYVSYYSNHESSKGKAAIYLASFTF